MGGGRGGGLGGVGAGLAWGLLPGGGWLSSLPAPEGSMAVMTPMTPPRNAPCAPPAAVTSATSMAGGWCLTHPSNVPLSRSSSFAGCLKSIAANRPRCCLPCVMVSRRWVIRAPRGTMSRRERFKAGAENAVLTIFHAKREPDLEKDTRQKVGFNSCRARRWGALGRIRCGRREPARSEARNITVLEPRLVSDKASGWLFMSPPRHILFEAARIRMCAGTIGLRFPRS